MCGVSDDRCIGCSFVRWLFGGFMVGLLVVLCLPLWLSFLAMPGLCCVLCVSHILMIPLHDVHACRRLYFTVLKTESHHVARNTFH